MIGLCGAVLVYVTIVALQAFYMQRRHRPSCRSMADYGSQDRRTLKDRCAPTSRPRINEYASNPAGKGATADEAARSHDLSSIPIDVAMKLVVFDGGRAFPIRAR